VIAEENAEQEQGSEYGSPGLLETEHNKFRHGKGQAGPHGIAKSAFKAAGAVGTGGKIRHVTRSQTK
jgi:hypothetical protein